MRNSATCFLPKHAAVASWKHRALSLRNKKVSSRGSWCRARRLGRSTEVQSGIGAVAAEARLCIVEQHAAGTIPAIGTHDPADAERLPDDQRSLEARRSSSERTIRDMLCKKTEAKQTCGTLTTATSCAVQYKFFPTCKPSTAHVKIGAERNRDKQESHLRSG